MAAHIVTQPGAYTPPLLQDSDPAPYDVINKTGTAPCLILADHAGSIIPEKLENLGLQDNDLTHHAACDPGTRHMAENLARRLDAPAIAGNYSRLTIDLNRRTDHPTAFADMMEDKAVPGNVALSDNDRACRIAEIYDPYHREIEHLIHNFRARDVIPLVISLHSFTPVFYKQERPWEIGILWVQDSRAPLSLIRYFARQGYCVGNNEPYDAKALRGTSVNRHADDAGLPNALIEYRQNEIDTPEKIDRWAAMTAEAIREVLADEGIHSLYDGPRATYDYTKDMNYFKELTQRAQKGE